VAREFERIAEIERRLRASSPDIALGIGDDAALLRPSARAQAITVDAQVEGVHFDRAFMAPADIGFRALSSAVSDLCAMGARPRAALCALIVPASLPDSELYAIADGIAQAQHELACIVAGGNLAAGESLSLTTTAIGDAPLTPLTRDGARAGDALMVTGTLGASALGLRLLRERRSELAPACVARFLRPLARVQEGQALPGIASAAIDVSDGLLQDLGHVAEASKVGFEVDLAALPLLPEFRDTCRALGVDPDALALTGGEDYELLWTCPEHAAQSWPGRLESTQIGRATAEPGIRLRDASGRLVPAPAAAGFDHFRHGR
jgi:thiamine-monophosphate kinase